MAIFKENGSALLNAIIVAGIVAGIAGILLSQTRDTDKMSRNPRIKSAMTVLETQMLSVALQPGIYQGCSAQAQNCQLNSNAVATFQHLAHNIVGAHCSSGSSYPSQQQCGVKVQAASSLACLNSKNSGYNSNCAAGQFYNSVTQTFCAEIVYQGTELAVQPVCASTTVPQSVLQGDSTACTSATNLAGPYPKVIFRGYDSAGNAVCTPIPSCSGGNVASAGNYITAIDKVSMQTQCKVLNTLLSCPPGTVMTNLKWTSVSSAFGFISPSVNCIARRIPADAHQVQAATPITVPPGTYTVVTVTTVPSTPTTIASSPSTTVPGQKVSGETTAMHIVALNSSSCSGGFGGGANNCSASGESVSATNQIEYARSCTYTATWTYNGVSQNVSFTAITNGGNVFTGTKSYVVNGGTFNYQITVSATAANPQGWNSSCQVQVATP